MWLSWILFVIYCQHIDAQYGVYNFDIMNKPTRQSSLLEDTALGSPGTSDKAVDGNTDNVYEHGSCTHTNYEQDPWWAVDLDGFVTVFSVTIVSRVGACCDHRLDQLFVYGSNTSFNPYDDPDRETCYFFNGVFGDGVTRTFECDQPMTARYLSIALPVAQNLHICEVQITAVCPDDTYGVDCGHDCSNNCKTPPCDKFTANGVCLNNGCISGYRGDNCSEACPHGTYGEHCKYDCSPNCKNQCSASSDIGRCNDGCKPGYVGYPCETECNTGSFGQDCLEKCYCKQRTCDHITGMGCAGKCADGYTGDTCSIKSTTPTETPTQSTRSATVTTTTPRCPSGYFGQDCTKICHCKQGTCDPDTGWACPGGCQDGYEGDTCSAMMVGGTQPSTANGSTVNIAAITGGVAAAVVILVIVILVILITRRRRLKGPQDSRPYEGDVLFKSQRSDAILLPQASSQLDVSHESRQEILSEGNPELEDPNGPGKVEYVNVAGERVESKTKLKLTEVGSYIQNMNTKEHPFSDEYEAIPRVTAEWTEAGMAELKSKNRFINILPYNQNRVKLQPVDNDPLSTYINASYIKDFDGQTSFIAALGTTDKTLNDFWRMIWETKISSIVMVTKLMEESRTKCIRYWPFGQKAQFGEITVSMEHEEKHGHFVKRTMKATVGKKSRVITHYHYTAWPDKQAPGNLSSILQLREELKKLRVQKNIPILVHCSAGIGRTGTLIALDILLDQLDKEGSIDVQRCVMKLREQRTQMVQTLDQYIFLYNAFHEIAELGRTVIPTKNINTFVKSTDFQTMTAKQFNFLETVKPEFSSQDLLSGAVENQDKNRDQAVIADDEHRVMLMSNPDLYINAVYVEDYQRARAFCATQLPLQETVCDLWRMMFELKSAAVVCLETDQSDTWQWIPSKDHPIVSGTLYVGLKEEKIEAGYNVYTVDIRTNIDALVYANVAPKLEGDEFHQLRLFVLKSWTSVPLTDRELIPLQSVLRYVQASVEKMDRKLITVICKNGATEAGLYIALSILTENVKCEHEVDVFQVVKLIRKSRPQFVPTQEQYNWLYQAISKMAPK